MVTLTRLLTITFLLGILSSVSGQDINRVKQEAAVENLQGSNSKPNLLKVYSYHCHKRPVLAVLNDWTIQIDESFCFDELDMANTKPVSLNFNKATLNRMLDSLVSGQPLTWIAKNGIIYIKVKENYKKIPLPDTSIYRTAYGRVMDEYGRFVEGAMVVTPRYDFAVATNGNGEFTFEIPKSIDSLLVSRAGFKPKKVSSFDKPIIVYLPVPVQESVEVNHKKINPSKSTENITYLKGPSLPKQPGRSVPQIISGAAAGVYVKGTGGGYGSFNRIQIRNSPWIGLPNGKSSITDNEPLIILDNVQISSSLINQMGFVGGSPFATGPFAGGLSILRIIDPAEIESIAILKDADATAIYGSKGANGVIVINTKKGQKGQPFISADVAVGFAKSKISLDLMNSQQYIESRRSAYDYDNLQSTDAPDLLYDSTRYTDYRKLFWGGTAKIINAHITTTGAIDSFKYRLSFNYYKEGSIMPGKQVGLDYHDEDISFKGSFEHKTKNNKLTMNLDGWYVSGKTNSATPDIGQLVRFFPNAPSLLDSAGNIIWYPDFTNPYTNLLYTYGIRFENALSHLGLSYKIAPRWNIKANFGLNLLNVDEEAFLPIKAQNPIDNPTGTADFASSFNRNMLFELMGEYNRKGKKINTTVLGGLTLMKQKAIRRSTSGTGYTSDVLLRLPQAAETSRSANYISEYGYVGLWLNSKSEISNKYLINLTLRADGSSRFGPQKKYGLFWALGSGWVLSNAVFLRLPKEITQAKITASVGKTGNDAVGDYNYNSIYTPVQSGRGYGGITGFAPVGHANEKIGWVTTTKAEIATQWTFKDKLTLTASYYRNVTTRQLISQSLPAFTGFGTIIKNFDAKVISKGIELTLQKKANEANNFYWTSSFVLTLPQTQLKEFPGLANSNYANTLVIGQPLTVRKGFKLLSIDPKRGLYKFEDVNGDGILNAADYHIIGDLDPDLFGGIQNQFVYKRNLTLDFSFDFGIQQGINHLVDFYPMRFTSDGYSNVPTELLDRWKSPVDIGKYQAFSAKPGSEAFTNLELLRNSDFSITNANFLRLKNISLSYSPPKLGLFKKAIMEGTIYVMAENLFILTKYKYADPITQNPSGIPMLTRFTAGLKLNFK